MDASIIMSTRNRAHALTGALGDAAAAIRAVPGAEVELVVVDNGSTDGTGVVLHDWARQADVPTRVLREERQGLSIARNTALRASTGRLVAFIDDDCRPAPDYLADLLAHDRSDGQELVLRGGRVELGDPGDQPFTIITREQPRRCHKVSAPVRGFDLAGLIFGCNMACRREVLQRIGLFDERFGAGGPLRAAEDSDFLFRAYLAGVTVEYVPDMVVRHFHGRRQADDIRRLLSAYDEGAGAIYAKYWSRDLALVRQLFWDLANLGRELGGRAPDLGYGHTYRARLASKLRGALRYWKHELAAGCGYREPRLERMVGEEAAA